MDSGDLSRFCSFSDILNLFVSNDLLSERIVLKLLRQGYFNSFKILSHPPSTGSISMGPSSDSLVFDAVFSVDVLHGLAFAAGSGDGSDVSLSGVSVLLSGICQ